ncbi:unnamed protein product [Alopecurus aequalis]
MWSMAARRWLWPQPATVSSQLCHRTRITGTCPSRCPSVSSLSSSSPGQTSASNLRHLLQFFGTSSRTVKQQQATKQHLYLVLDDTADAFTIHKLDMDDDLDDGGSAENPLCFPKPPLRPLDQLTVPSSARFAAIGGHIIATCPNPRARAIPVGDTLYTFESFTNISDGLDDTHSPGGLHCLTADPCSVERPSAWLPLSNSSQFCWSWNRRHPEIPFDAKTITAHAVHPRTGTIFMSVTHGRVRRGRYSSYYRGYGRGLMGQGTYSYCTRGSGGWTRRGDWMMPFKGHAHYDNVLDAWVGLDSVSTDDANGYLCVCSVVSGKQQPNWKLAKEIIFLKHPLWRHVDAKLVHMREHNKYCLVERLVPKEGDKPNHMLSKEKYVLCLITFVVKYDEDGKLKIMVHQPARFYKAPLYCCVSHIQAFWM